MFGYVLLMFDEVMLAYQSNRITVATSFYRPTRKVDATRSVNAPRIMLRLWPIFIITRPVGFTSEFGQRVWPTSNLLLFVSGPLDWLPRRWQVL